jgi:hypothetical protein
MKVNYTIDKVNEVVIGSGSLAECYFQICNFMNMLYMNIGDNKRSMSNKVIRHNIQTYFDKLNLNILQKLTDPADKQLFLSGLYADLSETLDRLIENMEQTYKMAELNVGKTPEIVKIMKTSSYLNYELVWGAIKRCYTEYEFIKKDN